MVEVELAILGFHIAVGCIFWFTILMPKMGVAGWGSASLVTHSNLRWYSANAGLVSDSRITYLYMYCTHSCGMVSKVGRCIS